MRVYNRGVYSRDTVPLKLVPGAYIINTAPSEHPGTHWTAAWMSEEMTSSHDIINQHVDYFDSLADGSPPSRMRIYFNADTVLYNQRTLQSPDTDSCGMFALYFVFWECQGVRLDEIVNHFSDDKKRNERMVVEFGKRLAAFH